MTSKPNIAGGRTLPRYCTNFDVGLSDGNTRKGKNRVSIVPSTTIAIVIICSAKVIAVCPLSQVAF